MNELIHPHAWTRARADASSRRYGGNELPSEMIALEPRVMLDGAIALAAAEEAPADDKAAGDDQGATGEPTAQQAQNSDSEANAENSGTTPETDAASGPGPGKTIVIVDAAIEDPAALLEGIDPSADVFYLVAGADGVEQITNILAGQSNVSSLHILSHGDTGSVTIGATTLTLSNIETYAADFVGWDVAMAEGADILLYGCNIAEDRSGLDFIDLFAELTHTDVAASTDLTGAEALGGDWVLEAETGTIDTATPLNATALQGYQHTLVFGDTGANDFRISFAGPDGDTDVLAGNTDVAYNSTNNEYFVVWQADDTDFPDIGNNESEIFGRRIDGTTGAQIGGVIRLSDQGTTVGTRFHAAGVPKVAYNSIENEYLVVWIADDPDVGLSDNSHEVFGQRVDASTGAEVGANDFRISNAGESSGNGNGAQTLRPELAFNSTDNEYLVVWYADDTDSPGVVNDEDEIFGQRIDGATGAQIGANDFRISDSSGNGAGRARDPSIAYNSTDNEYLVVWNTEDSDAVDTTREVYGQRIDAATGIEVGTNDFRISDIRGDTAGSVFNQEVAYNSTDNEYLVVWAANDSDSAPTLAFSEYEVFGQRLNASTGAEVGVNDFRISDVGGTGSGFTGASLPKPVYNSTDNEYLVIWTADDPDSAGVVDNENEIFGQRIDAATGAEIGDNDFRISDAGGSGNTLIQVGQSAIAYNSTDNNYLAVWRADDTDSAGVVDGEREIFGQLLADVPVVASLEEIGTNDFRISDAGGTGDSRFRAYDTSVAYNATDNEYLVVWYADDPDNGTGIVDGEREIFGRRIDAETGAVLGSDFRISDAGGSGNTISTTFDPDVAYNSTNNEYLVVWGADDSDFGLSDAEFEVFGQRIAGGTGAEIGVDFRISDAGGNGQDDAADPAVAYNSADNEYLVVWRADDSDIAGLAAGEQEIFGQRIDGATGQETGINDFRISDMSGSGDSTFSALGPDLAYNAIANEFLVVWYGEETDLGQVDGETEIFGQRISGATGMEVGANDFLISDAGGFGDKHTRAVLPKVAHNSMDNEYLVVWHANDPDAGLSSNEFEILGQRLDAAGMEIGPNDFLISDAGGIGESDGDATTAAVAYNAVNGEYLVTWVGTDPDLVGSVSGEGEIFGQRLNGATGAEVGDNDFRISDANGTGSAFVVFDPAIAFNPTDNQYLVVWSADDRDVPGIAAFENEIFGQLLGDPLTNGAPVQTVPGPQAASEDTPLVFSAANGNTLSVTDDDAGTADIITTLSVTSGTLSVTDTGTATLAANGTATVTITGTVAEVNAALAAVTFTPVPHASGAVTLTMSTNDDGNTGSDGAKSDTDTIDITIAPVADTPTLVLDADGTPSPEFRINTFTDGSQRNPSVASLSGGGFVTAWRSSGQDGDGEGIFAQIFDSAGNPIGNEFRINTETAGNQTQITLIGLTGGGFLASWTSDGQDGSSTGIYGQRFDASGGMLGTEFQVNTTTTSIQHTPSIIELSGGDFVVAWSSLFQDGHGFGVYGQRFSSTGATVGGEFQINSTTDFDQSNPSFVSLAGDTFVVVWSSDGQDGDFRGIYGQRYDAAGAKVGGEFLVNTETIEIQNNASATALSGGGFVITWQSNDQDGDGFGIYGQRFDAAGAKSGTEFRINSFTSDDQSYPSVTALADGGFAVVWTSDGQDGDNQGLFAQRFDAAGNPVGAEFRVNSVAEGNQSNPSLTGNEHVATLADGRIVAVWHQSLTGATEAFARIIDFDDNSAGGLEDQPVAIMLDTILVDQDGSETLAVTLSGFPAGTSFNFGAAGAGNTWVIPNVQALDLSTLELTPPADYNGSFTLTATARATEGANGDFAETVATKEIVIAPVNDAPVVASPGAGLTAVDQDGLAIHGTGFSVADVDAAAGTVTATLTVTDGTLAVAAGGTGVSVANSNSAAVTVTGTIAQIDALLTGAGTGTIVYTASASPAATTTMTVTVNDGGNTGRDPGTSGGASSEEGAASQTIANIPSNTAPTLAGLDGAPVFTEGGVPVLIDSDVTVGDIEQNWDGGTATISGLDGSDTVAVRNIGNGPGETNIAGTTISVGMTPVATFAGGVAGTDLVITFNAAATNAHVEAVLENLVYSNASDAPAATRTLTITLADSDGADTSGDVIATVNPVNDNPVNGVPGAQTTDEDTDLVFSVGNGNGLSVSDLDAGASDITTTLSVTAGTLTVTDTGTATLGTNGTATVTITGTVAEVNAALATVTFTPTLHASAPVTLNMVTNDGGNTGSGGAKSDTDNVDITITPVADAPTLDIDADTVQESSAQVDAPGQTTRPNSTVTALAGGGFVVAWHSRDLDGDSFGIFAQLFDASGTALGSRFQVNTETTDQQLNAHVTALSTGGFIITWDSEGQDGDGDGVFGQRYDAAGNRVGTEFQINTETFHAQQTPAIAELSNGEILVAWESAFQDGSSFGVFARRFDAAGNALGSEFQVNTYTDRDQFGPAIGALNGGGFVITWASDGQDGDIYGIYGQRYDVAGMPVGGEFQISTETVANQIYPSLAVLAGGDFVVAWESFGDQDGSGPGVFGQRFDASGNPLGGEFQINTVTAGQQGHATVAALPDGGFIVTWSSEGVDGSGFGISGQRYDANGLTVGDEFPINDITTGDQRVFTTSSSSQTAVLADGRIVSVWDDINANDGSASGTSFRIVNIDDAPNGLEDQALAILLDAVLVDQDGSETLAVTVSGFPAGTTFNFGAAGAGNTWVIPDVQALDLSTLELTPPADYNGTFTLSATARATEGANGDFAETTATKEIVIAPVNDTPTVAAPGAALTSVDQIGLDIHGTGFSAVDIDAAGGTVTATLAVTEGTLAVSAGNSGVTVANSNSASVTVTGTIGQINNLLTDVGTGTIVYTAIATPSATTTITVTVNDGGNTGRDPGTSGDANSEEASASQTIANTLSNTAPTLAGLDGAPVFTEGGAPVLIDGDVTVGDTEQNWDGGTATISGLDGSDSVAVRNIGNGPGQTNIAGTTISVGTTPVATFTGGASGTNLVITFNAAATNADVEAVLENLVYSNASDAPAATRTLTITLADGDGADVSGDVVATVNPVNDAPETNAATAGGAEDAASISVALSGTDIDGTVASFRVTSLPADGTLFSDAALNNSVALNDVITATGNAATLFFVPNPDFNGAPSFTFAAIDDLGLEDATPATASITVNPVNDAPETNPATGAGNEDATSISVALSGSDVDGTVASFRITSLPADGALFSDAALNNPVALNDTIAATGNAATLFFVPNPNFNGTPTFSFASTDNQGLEDASPATATITVNAVNDAPETNLATGTGDEDAASISVALSGTDIDGTVASFRITSLPANGTLFSDAALNNSVALNDIIAATGNAATLFFVPNPDFNGTPTFTFASIDNQGLEDSSPATATITVNPVNDAPQTATATGAGAEDAASISVALSGSDIDGTVASFMVTSLPADGILFSDAALNNPVALNDTIAATGNAATLFFVPNPDFNGTPAFTFAAIDDQGLEDASPATATITVGAVNDAPETNLATGAGNEDAASISVALSGSDVDGNVASFRITSLPADGTLFSDAALNNPVALNDTIAATGNAATLFFVPNPDFNGTPTFTFAAIDTLGLEDASPATATITVNAVNDAPQTAAATGAGAEDAASISVALSGSDVDGNVASFRLTSLPANGTLFSDAALNNPVALNDTIAATGDAATLFFVPNLDFNGTPTFTFAAIDNQGLQDASPATATITVGAVNDAPQTAAASATGAEDAATIAVALSGTDVDGTVASFRITSLPADGTLFSDAALNNPVALNDTIAATGNAATLFFVPDPDFSGTPTFTFASIDNQGLEDASPATATITVNPVNDAPQTAVATGTGAEDAASISVALSGNDLDGNVASFRVTSLPADGTLFSDAALNNPIALNDTVTASGNAATLFFVPNPDFNGTPTFTFAAIDNQDLEDASPATATITVNPVNDAPQTAAATAAGAEDAASISVALTGSDVDGTVASFRITSLPANGTLFSDAALNNPVALNDAIAATGNAATLFFVPNSDFNGTPTFTFAAIDNLGLEDASPATATITVNAINDAPQTAAATGAGAEDAASISVALSGSDVDGNVASFRITSLPADGTLFSDAALNNPVALNDTVAAAGNAANLFFVPNPNFNGTPTFTFATIDNLGLEDASPATATITVGAVNDAPQTAAATGTGTEDAASISVALSGTDVDGTVASFRITSLPADGTLFSDAALNNPVVLNDTIAATGDAATLFFVPNLDFNGTPTFTFAAIDNQGLEDASPATATITVSPVNDAPETNLATGAGTEDAASISVALSGSDVDGNVASFRITSLPDDGTLFSDAALNNPIALNDTIAATANAATLFFVPDPNFSGAPAFTFAAIDNLGLEDATPATATITVGADNDAPETSNAVAVGAEDAASIAVTITGSDIDGTIAFFRVTSLPADGTLFSDAALNNPVPLNGTIPATGNAATLFFVPNPDFNGTPTFTFAAIDDLGLEDASAATATITVTAENDAPTTNVAAATGNEDAVSVSISLSGNDVDGTVASFRVTSLPANGTLFSDAALNNPVALNDIVPAAGNAATLFFVPNPDFNGAPTFTFAAIDDLGLEDASPATATITVNAVNDAPETIAANAAGDEDAASISIDLSGTDIDGTVASFRITSLPSDGTLFSDAALNNPVALNGTVAANNNSATLFFVPNANFNGAPSFTFAAIDDLGFEDDTSATATISVNPVNDAPETGAAVAAGLEDAASISVNLSGGDIDGSVASFRITGLPKDGTLFSDAALNNPIALNDTVAAAGNAATLFFVPNGDFNGTPTFTFAAIDDLGLEDATPATATITVDPVNDAPSLASLGGDIADVLAGGAAAAIDIGANAAISDRDGATDFNGGFIKFDITAGTDNGSFVFDGVDVTSGGDATISANETIRVGGTVIGTVSAVAGQDGQAGNLLRIDFDAGSATPAALSTLVRSLHYAVPDGFGDRTLTTTLNDGDGTADGGADETVVVSTIRVPVAPQVQSIERQDPASAQTNADSVTFRVTFDADVSEIDAGDFALSGTLSATSSVTGVTRISANVYDVAVDVPDDGDGTINLDISATPSVQNGAGINIRASAMSLGADETYTIDNTAPAVPLADLAAASDRGASDTDDITNDTTPTITGTVDANTTVTILSSIDGQVGEDSATTYNGAGIITSALTDGVHTLTILSTDVAGNSSMTQLTITIDTIAPTATAIGSPIAPADDAVVTFSETITFNDGAATFMTTLNAGAVVQDNFLATNANTSLSGGNTLTFTRPTALALGSTFSAQIGAGMVTDIAGNTNAALTDVTTLIFETFGVPAAPAGLDLIAPSDTGQSSTDDITADATPTISGTADANATINLTSSLDGLVGTIQADADGNWSITTSALRDGIHDFTATATNPAAVGPASAILSVTVDTTIRTPATPDLTAASDTGASSIDNVTFDKTPTLTGTAEPGATVTLTSSISGTVGTAVASAAGTWTMTTGTLPEGDHVFTVGMVDIAGNVSPQSPGLTVTIATETTESPETVGTPDDGQSSTGTDGSDIAGLGTSNDGPGGPSGDGSPTSNFDPSSPAIGSGFTGQNNQDGGLPPAGRTPQGADPIITAGLGEQRPLSGDVLSESDLPGSINLDPASDSGFSNTDNRTGENQPAFNGEAPANSIVTITSSLGGVLGTARVDATGKWTFQSPALADGQHELIATPADEEGNKGVPSLPLLATIDTIAPETPAPPAVDGDVDQFRSDESQTFKGKAEPGARIVLTSDQDGVVGEVIADENGNWQIEGEPLSENAHALTVTATDEAGNASAASQALNIVVRGANDTALNFDVEDPIRIDVAQGDGSVAFDAVDMTALLQGFTRNIEGFDQERMENAPASQAVGFTRQLQRADAERMFA